MKTLRPLWIFLLFIIYAEAACLSLAAAEDADHNPEKIAVKPTTQKTSIERVYSVASEDFQWFDSARSRQVQAKIYYPTTGKGPFPIIVFSHGLGRSCQDCAYLGTHWASRGCVSVFVEHAGSDEAAWRGKRQPFKHLKEIYENPETMQNRPLDMTFAIDQLAKLKRDRDPLGMRLDLDRIGAGGCDLGAQTALVLAGQLLPGGISAADHRIRAALAMSPSVPIGQVPLNIAYNDIQIPCLYLTGSEDDGIVGDTKAFQRRLPFDYSYGADQYLAIFQGGDHMIYSGHIRQREGDKDARFQPLIRDASTLFWEAYLQEKPNALAAMRSTGLNTLLGRTATVEKKLLSGNNSH